MNTAPQSGVRWRRFPLAMLLLMVAVFSWGLHAKLSLYSPAVEAVASAPAAKLLSSRERTPKHEASSLGSQAVPAALLLLATALVFRPQVTAHARKHQEPSCDPASALLNSSLFVRPPPPYFICA